MLSAKTVANTILYLAFRENVQVSPMKLQKLLYFAYKVYLQKTGKPLFAERFAVWKYGPVVPSVYDLFKAYAARPIDKFARNVDNTAEIINLNVDTEYAQAVLSVWDKYRYYSASELSSLTHRENSAWQLAYKKGSTFLEDEDIKNADY